MLKIRCESNNSQRQSGVQETTKSYYMGRIVNALTGLLNIEEEKSGEYAVQASTARQHYRKRWNTTNTDMPNRTSFGKNDGKTTKTICGVGRSGTTMRTLRYVTQMNSGWTSVFLVWALALTLLTSKQRSRCECVLFLPNVSYSRDLEPNVFTNGLVKVVLTLWLH